MTETATKTRVRRTPAQRAQVISRCVQAEGARLVSAHQAALNRALPR